MREWKLVSSDNEHKFFLNDTLVIHLFKTNELWHGNVLGLQEVFCDKSLTSVLKQAELGAISCGWIKE